MRDITLPPSLCTIDPISWTTLALVGAGVGAGAGASALASGGGGTPAAPAPPPSQPTPQQTPQARPQSKTPQPTFLGAAATPPTQSGQKTLLGS